MRGLAVGLSVGWPRLGGPDLVGAHGGHSLRLRDRSRGTILPDAPNRMPELPRGPHFLLLVVAEDRAADQFQFALALDLLEGPHPDLAAEVVPQPGVGVGGEVLGL